MTRPTHREIAGKLAAAKDAVAGERLRLVNSAAIVADLLELDLLVDELPVLLPRMLDELNPVLYKGARPPQKSYEDLIEGCELYAFSWQSKAVGCDMYFKFALKNDCLWIISLHQDRNRKKEE